jgi:hypothetical protein
VIPSTHEDPQFWNRWFEISSLLKLHCLSAAADTCDVYSDPSAHARSEIYQQIKCWQSCFYLFIKPFSSLHNQCRPINMVWLSVSCSIVVNSTTKKLRVMQLQNVVCKFSWLYDQCIHEKNIDMSSLTFEICCGLASFYLKKNIYI